jgi:hypothetical protein
LLPFWQKPAFLAVKTPIAVAVVSVIALKMFEFIQFFLLPHAGTALDQ